ncbi:DUF362 domain-containing protein [Clostridium arbusti]|uniref:DUF362 domain-containing protein n=1 Tax=Clostridium arbusti TaxID=1137848 RepID=UPI0002886556|nr:DUF362 domain-containing protein [Clostridium arbusti]
MNSHVVITRAPKINYREDYVALPKNYGTHEYYEREDVQSIRDTVYKNLDDLDSHISFTKKLSSYKRILIKPNLVSVYHKSGLSKIDYPESTDPRVFDAIVSYIKQFNKNIAIVESSGKPMPTATSFKISGIDRVAKYHNTKLYALENQPVIRYMLPKAEVMKEVYIPEIFNEVILGESFYISVPKLKTNLYTTVTLGFKNAMGTIPYFMRERNHTYLINKKIADLLYLFKPDLVIIDGIIGGEGNTPAPVDPVDVGVIISGNNSVEVDRIGTKVMGINPDDVALIKEAVKRNFNDDTVKVTGEIISIPFRKANPSLMDEFFAKQFPNVLVLAGHTLKHAPKITDIYSVTPEIARELEIACDGGCLAAARSGFDYVHYSPNPKYDFPLVIIIGSGININNSRYWFDRDGNAYSAKKIRSLQKPKLTLGNCASIMDNCAKFKAPGCCDPAKCMLAVTSAANITFPLLSINNKALGSLGACLIKNVAIRCFHIIRGKWVDCPRSHENKIFPIPELDDIKKCHDYIYWKLPKMTISLKRKCIKDQLSLLRM